MSDKSSIFLSSSKNKGQAAEGFVVHLELLLQTNQGSQSRSDDGGIDQIKSKLDILALKVEKALEARSLMNDSQFTEDLTKRSLVAILSAILYWNRCENMKNQTATLLIKLWKLLIENIWYEQNTVLLEYLKQHMKDILLISQALTSLKEMLCNEVRTFSTNIQRYQRCGYASLVW